MIDSIEDLNVHTVYERTLYAESLTKEYQLYLTVTGGFTPTKEGAVPDTLIEFNHADPGTDIELNTIRKSLYGKFAVNIRPKELTVRSIFEELKKCGFVKMVAEELETAIRCKDNIKNAKKHLVLYFHDIFDDYSDGYEYEGMVERYIRAHGMPERGYKMIRLDNILDKQKHVFKALNSIAKAEEVMIVLPQDDYITGTVDETTRTNHDMLVKMIRTLGVKKLDEVTVDPE